MGDGWCISIISCEQYSQISASSIWIELYRHQYIWKELPISSMKATKLSDQVFVSSDGFRDGHALS